MNTKVDKMLSYSERLPSLNLYDPVWNYIITLWSNYTNYEKWKQLEVLEY